jgi:DNA-directed RNA polymerase III subunit RPC4
LWVTREREELDAKFKAEQDAAEKNSESTRGRGGARGGRGRGGRGRGGMRGGAAELQMGASGPFALGSIVTAGRQKVMAERGLNTGRSQRSFNFKSKIKAENQEESAPAGPDYSSSDESDGEERMDVEYISLLDDSADEDGDFKMTPEWGSGAPIRIPRSEHLDRQVLVNTDSSSKKSKSELKALKDKEMTFETEIKIKDEPVEDEEGFIPSSPELSRRKVKVSASPERRRKQAPGEFESPRKPRSAKKKVVSTTEEKEEYERIDVDKKLAFYELAGAMEELDIKPLTAKGEDADGDIDMNAVCSTNCFPRQN